MQMTVEIVLAAINNGVANSNYLVILTKTDGSISLEYPKDDQALNTLLDCKNNSSIKEIKVLKKMNM